MVNIREKLMNAVIECLNEGDIKECTVKKVAAKAGVNHGMVHYCFGSKEQMFIDALMNSPKRAPLRHDSADRSRDRLKMMQDEYDNDKCDTDKSCSESIIDHFNSMPISNLFVELMMLANDMPKLNDVIYEIVQSRVERINEMTEAKDRDRSVIIISALIGLLIYKRLDKNIDLYKLQKKLIDITVP